MPALAVARFLHGARPAGETPGLIAWVLLAAILFLAIVFILRSTLVRWGSPHLGLMALVGWAYSGIVVVQLLVTMGWQIAHAATAGEVVAMILGWSWPLDAVAPAILLGPYLFALARDWTLLVPQSHPRMLLTGYTAVVGLLLLPFAVYLLGSWWATQGIRGVFTWAGFQHAVFAILVACVLAALGLLASLLVEAGRWRALSNRLRRAGVVD